MKKTKLQEARELMSALVAKRQEEMEKAGRKIMEAQSAAQNAEKDMFKATAALDPEAYAGAKSRRDLAKIEEEMYRTRLNQLQQYQGGVISEEDSDAVIDGLLDYEHQLGEAFRKDVASIVVQLRKIYEAYNTEVEGVEQVISSWHLEVRRNHKDRDRGIRSDKPIKVHEWRYDGVPEADLVRIFLDYDAIRGLGE